MTTLVERAIARTARDRERMPLSLLADTDPAAAERQCGIPTAYPPGGLVCGVYSTWAYEPCVHRVDGDPGWDWS